MRARDFLKEDANGLKKIHQVLSAKGYKKIGAGSYQTAYIEPGTGWILKIFDSNAVNQKTFLTFFDYCTKNSNNPFLPKFGGYETFVIDGKKYLQIRQEQLFETNDSFRRLISNIASETGESDFTWNQFKEAYDDTGFPEQILQVLNDQQATLLTKTIQKLFHIGDKLGYTWDLRWINFLMRKDGTPVIVDPWDIADSKLSEDVDKTDIHAIVKKFLPFVQRHLDLSDLPEIELLDQPLEGTFGRYGDGQIRVMAHGRHPIDVLRTLAHELVHYKQDSEGRIHDDSGETGSDEENEANAVAGVIMRDFDQANPELLTALKESQVPTGPINEFAPNGFGGFEDDDRVPMHFIVQKELYNRRARWKKSWTISGVKLFTTKAEAIQAVEKFNKLDPNREYKYGGTQLVDIDIDENKQGVAENDENLDEQVVDEWSDTDRGIGTVLKQKGYRKLGSGVDQTAYLEPGTGWILKIFGTKSDAHFTGGKPRFSNDHKMFFAWAKFCMGTDNPFLPRFGGYDSFEWKGKTYLQIRQEPLTKMPVRAGKLLWDITDWIEGTRGNSSWSEFRRRFNGRWRDSPDNNYFVQLLAVMGGDEVAAKLFYKTLTSLYKIGAKKGWNWDLHQDNFMMRGKTPVIVDPWVVSN